MPLPEPIFIQRNPEQIVADMIADYEARVGKRLEPAQVERLIINGLAYRELLLREQVNEAAKQNLIAFATFPMLDYLGELLGVSRQPASAAQATIQFTLVEGHGAVTIPQGLRVQSNDGRSTFQLIEPIEVGVGEDVVTGIARAQTVGEVANGYLPGAVATILDPQPYLSEAENTTTTGGGADEENDEQLRARIKLAPSSFSTAGPAGAYKFHALGAHPSIIDVAVTSPEPGVVNLWPLVEDGGVTPTEVLNAVLAACNAEKVRPLTDTVEAYSPTAVDYTIEVELELYTGTEQTATEQIVTANLESFRDGRKRLLGLDVILAQIIRECAVEGVYNVTVVSPSADLIIEETEYANCTDITVTTSGFNNG